MICVTDDIGREIRLPHAARRVVSLVPSLTEALFVLGCGGAVVGVTRYCTEPALPQGIDRIGGTKNPDVARVRELRPELVLVNAEENRREDFEALERGGLTLFVSFPRVAGDSAGLLRRLGRLTATEPRAEELAGDLERVIAHLCGTARTLAVPVFCPIWKNPWMSFNRDTYAHDMLAVAGGHNVCADMPERYGIVSLDNVAQAAPEVILFPDEPYVFTPKALSDLEPLQETPAWRHGRVHFIDGKALSWYGPRTAAALGYIRQILTR